MWCELETQSAYKCKYLLCISNKSQDSFWNTHFYMKIFNKIYVSYNLYF